MALQRRSHLLHYRNIEGQHDVFDNFGYFVTLEFFTLTAMSSNCTRKTIVNGRFIAVEVRIYLDIFWTGYEAGIFAVEDRDCKTTGVRVSSQFTFLFYSVVSE